MNYAFNLIIFTLGTSLVSFLTVIAHEYPHIKPTIRSKCDNCQRTLTWLELIPVWSYLITKGRCKYCTVPIDRLYPLTEFAGGTFLLVAALTHKNLIIIIPIFTVLTLLAISDHLFGYVYLTHYLLFVPIIIINNQHLHFIPALIIYTLLTLLNHLNKGIGSGDIEVLTILAFLLGLDMILKIILIACLACIIHFTLTKKIKFRFIPYISAAAYLCLLFW